ncbi:Protein SLG1 [Cytospora paraplurivora]|uniref:Protein SLG1 n=1 Tax=Cytospora paraplurivora TaxID=2898453 RepID=A0AAN9YFM6_9PEZI
MKTITFIAAVIAAAFPAYAADATTSAKATATATQGIEEASAAPTLGAQVVQGCFSSWGDLIFNSTPSFNTKSACGGIDFWTVYNTGIKLSIEYAEDNDTSTASATASSTASVIASSTVVSGGQTSVVYVTATPTPDTNKKGSKSTNVAGIVAGVVVGVVVVAAILGGIFFYMRMKRNREIEEDHRRNAAVNAFMGGKPPGSSGGYSMEADTRLDPVMAQRRLSSGSIADNQDYSRRILRVTNA